MTDPDAAPDAEPQPATADAEEARVGDVAHVRRAPRYRAFALAGALLAAVVAAPVALLAGRDGRATVAVVVTVVAAAAAGALLGSLVAVVLDRRS